MGLVFIEIKNKPENPFQTMISQISDLVAKGVKTKFYLVFHNFLKFESQ